MRISDKDMELREGDVIKGADWGGLVVERTIQLTVCRCRQCEDACDTLAEVPHLLCVHCNNHHTQNVNGEYKGPYLGPRRALEHLAKIKPDSEPCPICGSVPSCPMDCR